jgi:PadR family transcriptional regulator, regulatory protein AphA
MPKQNTSEFALLGLLSQGPSSGYDLRRKTEQQIGHFWSESFASIYPMLKRLLEGGFVERQQVEQTDKPDKWVYTITELGLVAFRNWLSEEIQPMPPRSILLMKVYFGSHTSNEELVKHIESYRTSLMDELGTNEQRIATIRQSADNTSSVYQLLTLSHSIHSTRAMLAWCKSALEILNQRED